MSQIIKVFKTIAGEDIIAEVVNAKSSTFTISVKNAANLVIRETERGASVALAPYMPFAEEDSIMLYTNALTAEANPDPALLKEYKRIYSPIITPQSSIIKH